MIRTLCALILCLSFFNVNAQNDSDKGTFAERIAFGGDLGLNFGTITYINISPLVGYKLTDHLTAGVGMIYQYVHYNKSYYGVEFESSTYGGRLFARQRFLENFFGTVEYQGLNVDAYNLQSEKLGRITVPVLFVGGGYLQQAGDRSFFSIAILYDVIQDFNSPYPNPVIQGGFIFNP